MTAHELIQRLQAVLHTRVVTGQLTLHLHNQRLQGFEVKEFVRLKAIDADAKSAQTKP